MATKGVISAITIVTILLCLVGNCSSYKVLIVAPLPSRSHAVLMEAAADILTDKGHEVTLISAYSIGASDKRYRLVSMPEATSTRDLSQMSASMSNLTFWAMARGVQRYIPVFISKLLDEAEHIIEGKDEKFDVVIVVHFGNEYLLGLGERFDCPVIFFTPLAMNPWLAALIGNPLSPEIYPMCYLPFTSKMGLIERTINSAFILLLRTLGWLFLTPVQEEFYIKTFPNESQRVPYASLVKRAALVLTSTHPSLGLVRPLLPKVVEIGGFHVESAEPLTEDLSKIMDDSPQGVILFSLGSRFMSKHLGEDAIASLINALGSVNQTVLWKFEDESLPNVPKNIILRKWMPQRSILAHTNIKLFITQGGQLSTIEAAHHGVPIIVVPTFGDQTHNGAVAEELGRGLMLKMNNLTESSLKWALNEVLDNPSYAANAKRISKLFHDRPLDPKDLFTYYVEHVVRTKGCSHLTPPEISWAANLLIDVMCIGFLITLIPVGVIVFVYRKCLKSKDCNSKVIHIKKNN